MVSFLLHRCFYTTSRYSTGVPAGIRNPAGKRIHHLVVADHHLKVPQGRAVRFAPGVAADHAAALLPAALAFDFVGGRAVLGPAVPRQLYLPVGVDQFAGSPPRPGAVVGQRRCGSWGWLFIPSIANLPPHGATRQAAIVCVRSPLKLPRYNSRSRILV